MEKHLWIVHAQPVAGMEDEFERWYETTHIPDLLDFPEFVSGQLFKLDPASKESPAHDYIVVYEVDGPLDRVFEKLGQAKSEGKFFVSEAFDPNNKVEYIYKPVTEKLK